jgi:hypothetical protein
LGIFLLSFPLFKVKGFDFKDIYLSRLRVFCLLACTILSLSLCLCLGVENAFV